MTPQYSTNERIDNFNALLKSYDFSTEVALFGLKRYQFLRRKVALRELKAAFIALWNLALTKSFPDDNTLVFEEFLSRYSYVVEGSNKDAQLLLQKVAVYDTLMQKKGDKDFSEVADFMADLVLTEKTTKKRIGLKLALALRAMYSLIFEKLI